MGIDRISSYNNFLEFGEKKSINNINKGSFGDLLSNALNQVNQMQVDSDEYKKMLAVGEVDNLHDITIASEKANIALQITMSIRNKIVEAYKEIMRIQI